MIHLKLRVLLLRGLFVHGRNDIEYHPPTRRSRTRTKGEVHWANNIDRNIVGGTRLGLNQRYR